MEATVAETFRFNDGFQYDGCNRSQLGLQRKHFTLFKQRRKSNLFPFLTRNSWTVFVGWREKVDNLVRVWKPGPTRVHQKCRYYERVEIFYDPVILECS